MPRRHAYVHEAVAAAVRRKFPQLTVTSDYPGGEIDGYTLDIKGGTKAEPAEALTWAKKYADVSGALLSSLRQVLHARGPAIADSSVQVVGSAPRRSGDSDPETGFTSSSPRLADKLADNG